MKKTEQQYRDPLFEPLQLLCGRTLQNRIVKSAMSDSLGDGAGNPTDAQMRLYERWALSGVAASIIGEVQNTPLFAEKPGNLVLDVDSDQTKFRKLAEIGSTGDAQLWLQLGHAGAMAYPPISTPKGPSAIDISGLSCTAMSINEIHDLPAEFARTAVLAQSLGFGGVQIHAAHGFLLSQFLSPLFNKRVDDYGGPIESRMRLLLEIVEAVTDVVGRQFVIAVKLNATDQLAGGFDSQDALKVIAALNETRIDLIDISGGTYFPGAKSASDSAGSGPYFIEFASHARKLTSKPLMVTGGFKTKQQAVDAIASGNVDLIGVARAFALDPELPNSWRREPPVNPQFPRFTSPPEGGVTAWYTMRLTQIGEYHELSAAPDLEAAMQAYDERDNKRIATWLDRFS